MAPLTLEGDTLGQKHQNFNKLVKEALANKQVLEPISGEDDIQNLVKIDVACKTRDVEFLLEVLKSEDMLYVSRAIKNCLWLVTDKQYSNIVNPEYLYTQIKPHMTTKAFNKLMLFIRLNLKDEDRAEVFYKYHAQKSLSTSYKWLQYCPVTLIENVAKNEDIPEHILLRLFEKSFSIFEAFMSGKHWDRYGFIKKTVFLAGIDPERYLNVLEKQYHGDGEFYYPDFGFTSKTVEIFMKQCPNRILDKFELYYHSLHLPTFAKLLKEKEDIKIFLLKHAENEKLKSFYTYNNMQHFIKYMAKESKFEFVQKIFINKEPLNTSNQESYEDCESDYNSPCSGVAMQCLKSKVSSESMYQWYRFIPFDVAFKELKKLIRTESAPSDRNAMLQVLLSCAGQNMNHVKIVLKYYLEKHINEPFKFKIQFVNNFISNTKMHLLDEKTWDLLNKLFQSMEVYIESSNSVHSCVKAIVIRHVIRGEKVPDIIQKKFVFDTMKEYQRNLKTQKEKDAVFTFLHDHIVTKNKQINVYSESRFGDAVKLCEQMINLIIDWKKDLQNYPYVIERVKLLITIKRENSWKPSMASLYEASKPKKRLLFDESISLCQTREVCLNTLKHDPGLIMRQHKNDIIALFKNDAFPLKELLTKIRIYWADSLAEEYKTWYLDHLELIRDNRALVNGLCTLLPQEQLTAIAKKYAPTDSKIDWNAIDEIAIGIQKQLARNIRKARPLIPLDTVLWYAIGDYLQFAVPSLNSVLSQLSVVKIRQQIHKVLEAPVSLQKFGVRCAFDNLDIQELKLILAKTWKSTKNSTIRTVLFTHTHALLCKEENTTHIKEIWELLSMFIDNLSFEENKRIYNKLGLASEVPFVVRAQFFTKSYTFLKSLPAKADCYLILQKLDYESPDLMQYLDDNFIINVMFKNIDENFTKKHDDMYENGRKVASYMLSCKDEEAEARRYELFLAPLLDRNLPLWNEVHKGQYHVKHNLKEILMKILYYIDDYNLEKKMNIPVKTCVNIQSKLEAALSSQKDYVFITSWKLAVGFLKLVNENKDILLKLGEEENNKSQANRTITTEKLYAELHKKIGPSFGTFCVQLLKKDIERFYPSVYSLFSKSLEDFLNSFLSYSMLPSSEYWEYYKGILKSSQDREVYLAVYPFLPRYVSSKPSTDIEKERLKEMRQILVSHPSEELKMHYYYLFNEIPDKVG